MYDSQVKFRLAKECVFWVNVTMILGVFKIEFTSSESHYFSLMAN